LSGLCECLIAAKVKVRYVSEFSISLLQNTDGELPVNQREIDHYTADVSAILIEWRAAAPYFYAADKNFFWMHR